MKNDTIVVLGANILGLYSAIKLTDNGFNNITIIDKNLILGRLKSDNHIFFHKNHTLYIELLQRFNIKFTSVNIVKNNTLQYIIYAIINKSKIYSYKSLICQSFLNFTKKILSFQDYNYLKESIISFEIIFEKINVLDAIEIFTKDINIYLDYYVLEDDINLLVFYMIEYLKNKGIIFLHKEIIDFKYNNNKFILYSKNDVHKLTCSILLTTLSKKNLLYFKFWNTDQKILLNSSTNYNFETYNFYNHLYTINKKQELTNDTKTYILQKTRLVFPQYIQMLFSKKNDISLWNIGINNQFTRDKLKYIYNNKFILCSDSYSKNNLFINYSLELFYSNFSKIIKFN